MDKTATENKYEIIALLQWYKSAGVDIAVNENAANQFSRQVTSSAEHRQTNAFGAAKTDINAAAINTAKSSGPNRGRAYARPHAGDRRSPNHRISGERGSGRVGRRACLRASAA